MKERIKFIIKLIIKIILAILCLIILHYLFKDKFLEFTGIWSFVEKILLCLLAYGIHLLVEWIANKKFPSDQADKDRTYMTIFVYKVRENLYFDGEFCLPEDSSLSADEIVSAIFQKVECC